MDGDENVERVKRSEVSSAQPLDQSMNVLVKVGTFRADEKASLAPSLMIMMPCVEVGILNS